MPLPSSLGRLGEKNFWSRRGPEVGRIRAGAGFSVIARKHAAGVGAVILGTVWRWPGPAGQAPPWSLIFGKRGVGVVSVKRAGFTIRDGEDSDLVGHIHAGPECQEEKWAARFGGTAGAFWWPALRPAGASIMGCGRVRAGGSLLPTNRVDCG